MDEGRASEAWVAALRGAARAASAQLGAARASLASHAAAADALAGEMADRVTSVLPPEATTLAAGVATRAVLGTVFWFGVSSGLMLARARVRARRAPKTTLNKDIGPEGDLAPSAEEGKQAEDAVARLNEMFCGAMTSAMISVGSSAGLFNDLAATGAQTPAQLAHRTGLNERWLAEWMCQLAAAKVLDFEPAAGAFALAPGMERALLDPWDPRGTHSAIAMFKLAPAAVARIAGMEQALHTGVGEPFDGSHKEEIADAIATFHYHFAKSILCDDLLTHEVFRPSKLQERLAAGDCHVAEVGCGTGKALCEMGRRFPDTHFDGYEISSEAIAQADGEIRRARLHNVSIWDVREHPMGHAAYDLVVCMDVIHDCTEPMQVLRDVRKCIKADGHFLVIDIKTHEDLADRIRDPSAVARFGISCAVCLHSSTSEPGGAGLGIMGLHEGLFRDMAAEAGFSRFQRIEAARMPGNAVYVLRP